MICGVDVCCNKATDNMLMTRAAVTNMPYPAFAMASCKACETLAE